MAFKHTSVLLEETVRKKRFVNDLTGKSSKNPSGVILIVIRQEVSARHNIKKNGPGTQSGRTGAALVCFSA